MTQTPLSRMHWKYMNGSARWIGTILCCLMLAAPAARADPIADLYQRLLVDPRSLTLNLDYARAAERAGKLKWALPAYERALSVAPGNREAQSGIDRITAKLRDQAARP